MLKEIGGLELWKYNQLSLTKYWQFKIRVFQWIFTLEKRLENGDASSDGSKRSERTTDDPAFTDTLRACK